MLHTEGGGGMKRSGMRSEEKEASKELATTAIGLFFIIIFIINRPKGYAGNCDTTTLDAFVLR